VRKGDFASQKILSQICSLNIIDFKIKIEDKNYKIKIIFKLNL
jgi:hypothetical protein